MRYSAVLIKSSFFPLQNEHLTIVINRPIIELILAIFLRFIILEQKVWDILSLYWTIRGQRPAILYLSIYMF